MLDRGRRPGLRPAVATAGQGHRPRRRGPARAENPFFARLAQSIEQEFVQAAFTPVICTQSLGGIHEEEYVRILIEHGVAGILFVSGVHAIAGADPSRYSGLTGSGLPVVMVNGDLPGSGAACLATDDAAMVDLAVAHLAHMGHRRIGLALGQARYTPVARRAAAFGPSLRRHVDPGLSDDAVADLVVHTQFTIEGGASAAASLLGQRVTGIVAGSDVMALGAMRAVRQRGLSVPGDVSVVGADDSFMSEFVDPPLTTVRQPSMALAATACRLLLELIAGAEADGTETLLVPELVVRGSTGRVPGGA